MNYRTCGFVYLGLGPSSAWALGRLTSWPTPRAVTGCKPEASKTNQECVKCREQAVDAVREMIWRVDGMMDPVPVPPLEVGCKGSGYGMAEGWTSSCAVFCSDGCRIRHGYSEFFSRVSSFLN